MENSCWQSAAGAAKDLLLGYVITLEIWMLQERLAHPETESAAVPVSLYSILGDLADGRNGYERRRGYQ